MQKINLKKVLLSLLLVVAVFGLVGCGKKQPVQVEQPEQKQEELNKEVQETEEVDTSNWQTYKNEEYGFELRHPKEWNMERNDVTAWKSFHFNKTECLKYKGDVCEDEFLSVNISDKPDNELRASSLWSWAIPEYSCSNSDERKIPLLEFNISYPVQACELNALGYKWRNYMFAKDDSRWLFVIRYNDEGYDSPIAKKILETFQFTAE